MSKLKIRNGSTWEEIPAGGVGVPSGGTAGQVLMKSSATDYADEWADISEAGAMSAWELLWTNASPTSAFAAQTVALDLSGYDAVLIDVNCAYELPDFGTCFVCMVGRGGFMDVWASSQNNKYSREATVASTGVTFGQGYFGTGANNNCAIPYRIYGIKGVN